MKKFLAVMLGVVFLPLGTLAEAPSPVDREPAAQKESTSKKQAKKKKAAKKAKSEGKKAKSKKPKKEKANARKKRPKGEPRIRSHAPNFTPPAADVGEVPEHLKDDLPPPNNGDLTE